MSDLSRLVEDACAWWDGPETATLSGLPETLSGNENTQDIDITDSFRSFHPFRSKNGHPGSDDLIGPETPVFSVEGSRASGLYEKIPERPETPERGGKTLAESTFSLFPVKKKEPERPETEGNVCECPTLDLNTAAPQRSDWWTGDLMAEADRLSPPAEPLPIPPAAVRAGVARELRALAEDGREGPDALRDAIEITRAKVRNSEALIERQVHPGLCHACGEPLDEWRPVVAVMQAKGGGPLWLHHGECHAEHSWRRAEMVDGIMVSAGYSTEEMKLCA